MTRFLATAFLLILTACAAQVITPYSTVPTPTPVVTPPAVQTLTLGEVCGAQSSCPVTSAQAATALGMHFERLAARDPWSIGNAIAAHHTYSIGFPDGCEVVGDPYGPAVWQPLLDKIKALPGYDPAQVAYVQTGNEHDIEPGCDAPTTLAHITAFGAWATSQGFGDRWTWGSLSWDREALVYNKEPGDTLAQIAGVAKAQALLAGFAALHAPLCAAHDYGDNQAAMLVWFKAQTACARLTISEAGVKGSSPNPTASAAGLIADAKTVGAEYLVDFAGIGSGPGAAMPSLDSTGKPTAIGNIWVGAKP